MSKLYNSFWEKMINEEMEFHTLKPDFPDKFQFLNKFGREIKESWIQDRILVSQVYEAFLKNIN